MLPSGHRTRTTSSRANRCSPHQTGCSVTSRPCTKSPACTSRRAPTASCGPRAPSSVKSTRRLAFPPSFQCTTTVLSARTQARSRSPSRSKSATTGTAQCRVSVAMPSASVASRSTPRPSLRHARSMTAAGTAGSGGSGAASSEAGFAWGSAAAGFVVSARALARTIPVPGWTAGCSVSTSQVPSLSKSVTTRPTTGTGGACSAPHVVCGARYAACRLKRAIPRLACTHSPASLPISKSVLPSPSMSAAATVRARSR